MGELTASLAHEIKQPTTAALINAKTCLRGLGAMTPTSQRHAKPRQEWSKM